MLPAPRRRPSGLLQAPCRREGSERAIRQCSAPSRPAQRRAASLALPSLGIIGAENVSHIPTSKYHVLRTSYTWPYAIHAKRHAVIIPPCAQIGIEGRSRAHEMKLADQGWQSKLSAIMRAKRKKQEEGNERRHIQRSRRQSGHLHLPPRHPTPALPAITTGPETKASRAPMSLRRSTGPSTETQCWPWFEPLEGG